MLSLLLKNITRIATKTFSDSHPQKKPPSGVESYLETKAF